MTKFNPFDHLGFLTNRVARLLNQHYEDFLLNEGYDFPVSCIGILADLWSKDGVNQKDLGVSLIKTKSSINQMLDALIKHGLVVKKDDPEDGRAKLIYLTTQGKKIQKRIKKKTVDVEEMFIHECTSEEISNTKKVLTVLYKNLYQVHNNSNLNIHNTTY